MSAIEDRVAKLKVSLPASSYILIFKKKWWGGNHILQSWIMKVKIRLVGGEEHIIK